jgi:hypothetical protein
VGLKTAHNKGFSMLAEDLTVGGNPMRHFIITTIFTLLFSTSFAQKDKEMLLQYFDKVDIYPSGKTIKTAYKVKNGKFDGYAVDFNEKGEPILIGQYKIGVRIGEWLMPDGHTICYDKQTPVIVVPAEARNYTKGKKEFDSLYSMFTTTQIVKQ